MRQLVNDRLLATARVGELAEGIKRAHWDCNPQYIVYLLRQRAIIERLCGAAFGQVQPSGDV